LKRDKYRKEAVNKKEDIYVGTDRHRKTGTERDRLKRTYRQT
jgi:hypothetical protein